MKAVVVRRFASFREAEFVECAEPVPGPGEVAVALEAADVNFPDILSIEGRYQNNPPLPFSPGLGGAGRVSALGTGVVAPAIGQPVLVLPTHGTYAQSVVAPAAHCFPMPEAMPFTVGAALGLAYQTAYFALTDRAALTAGDTVLVLGSGGGVGMAALQLAKALDARTVIAATRGESGRRLALKLGADAVVDTASDNLRDGLKEAAMRATDGRGIDIVVDPVGGELSTAAMRALAWRGRLVVIGFASGDIAKIGANYLLVKNISASGIQWTDYRDRQPDRVRAAQDHIFTLWTEGRLTPDITQTLPLSGYADALAALREGRSKGKSILVTRED